MEIIGLPDGKPTQHLGVSHMLKHYLSPHEVWEDLVPADAPYRPWVLLDEFDNLAPPLWLQFKEPDGSMRALWERLWVPVYRHGYLAVVCWLAARLPEPETEPWRHCSRGGRACATPEGVVLIVAMERSGPRLRTAFRTLLQGVKTHRDVPMDPYSRGLRIRLARSRAKQKVQLIGWSGR